MNKNIIEFDIKQPERAKWFAILVSQLQDYGARFEVTQDANIIYLEIK